MPDDLKIILTICAGLIAVGILCLWAATRPVTDHDDDDAYDGDGYRDPEHPEDEARRRQI